MTTTGGAEFQHGEDFVAARLSIDIPTDGIASLRELTQEIERFRVGAEAAGRAQDNFVQYLSQSAEAAERSNEAMDTLMAQMERVAALSDAAGTGGFNVNVPQGYVDPFDGAESGRGRGPSSPAEAQGQIDSLRESDPRAYMNMQAARGNLRTGDIPAGSPDSYQLQEAANRVHAREQENARRLAQNPAAGPTPRGGGIIGGLAAGAASAGLAHQVMNEMGSGEGGGLGALLGGGGLGGMAGGLMSRLGGSAAAAGGLEGGALSGLLGGRLGGLGAAGLGLTGALAGYGMVQEGGERYQAYKNQGMVQGGGFGEGVGHEMSARIMAMDPFLSTDQSRQVIQASLTEGYSGKAHDMVTSFIASNLKDMNLSVAESVELLRTNIEAGGQSVTGLAMNLAALKEMSQSGSRSMPELMADFERTSRAGIMAGMSGPASERAALITGGAMSRDGDQAVEDIPGQIHQTMVGSAAGWTNMRTYGGLDVPSGMPPGAMAFLVDGDQAAQASLGAVSNIAKQVHQTHGSPERGGVQYAKAVYYFQLRMQAMGMPWAGDASKVQGYYDRIVYEGRDPTAEGTGKADEATANQSALRTRNAGSSLLGGIWSGISTTVSGVTDLVATTGSSIADVARGDGGNVPDRYRGFRDRSADRGGAVWSAFAPNHIPMMDKVVQEHGYNGFEVLDGDGKASKYNPVDRKMMEGLSSGDYTLRTKGAQGAGVPLSQVSQSGGIGSGGPARSEVSGVLRIEMDPAAQRNGVRAPSSVQLTPHEQRANAGYGGATPNNPPPGESPLTRGRRGW